MSSERPDPEAVLRTLKDFQQATARYAFRRMYLDESPSHRFLVADEVGLGKTLVARGIIAQAVDHLWDAHDERIDVIYVCSNQDIAQQNINRLGLDFGDCRPRATRITMLPSELAGMKQKGRLNLVSFTPATSFELASSTGMAKERALLGAILYRLWSDRITTTRIINMLHADRGRAAFEQDFATQTHEAKTLGDDFLRRFEKRLQEEGVEQRFFELSGDFYRRRIHRPPRELTVRRNRVIGELRRALARVCLDALEPDLIILDEFQRFRHLLSEDTDAGLLAHSLFNYSDEHTTARVLLLSATPYKMYTLASEGGEENHYRNFIQTADFLFEDADDTAALEQDLDAYRVSLYNLDTTSGDELASTRDRIQSRLRRVMARTERVAWTHEHDAMVETAVIGSLAPKAADFLGYCRLQGVATAAKQADAIEFWKSISHPLSFMADYRLHTEMGTAFENAAARPDLIRAIDDARDSFLSADDVRELRDIPQDNARLRWLLDLVSGSGLATIPWLPPTMPYYTLGGPWVEVDPARVTKLLVFSAWRAVPRSVASLVSHEVRRLLLTGAEVPESIRDRSQRPLHFGRLKTGGGVERPALITWLYPSLALAETCDPLRVLWAEQPPRRMPSLRHAISAIKSTLEPLIEDAAAEYSTPEGDSLIWNWAGSALLDAVREPDRVLRWLEEGAPAAWSQGDDATAEGAVRAAGQLAAVLRKEVPVGPPPKRIAQTLARVALGSPAVAAARAFSRLPEIEAGDPVELMTHASRIAGAFRTLFNQPETYAMVITSNCEPGQSYLRRSLAFTAAGGIQSLLDEYMHILRESEGLEGKDSSRLLEEISLRICDAAALPGSNLKADVVPEGDGPVELAEARLLCKFAMPFGIRVETTDDATRGRRLREGFNSPFWPFVLVSTSIGQEGLDFHWYCHAVAHWNLPHNPVDLEQREGRVHRYKGLAIRKNVAKRHAFRSLVAAAADGTADPWEHAFQRAGTERGAEASEITPFWLYPLCREPGDACVMRYVPNLPLSRDIERAERLSRSLAAYRLAFGQPRQEDLVNFLLAMRPDGDLAGDIASALIDLRPPYCRA